MKLHTKSHTDHVSPEVVEYILNRFADRSAFFIETFELPAEIPAVACGLYGPVMGDGPIPDADCVATTRPGRGWLSRTVDRPTRPTRTVTVIAGPFENEPCVLYTAFGGPLAPKEPGDPTLSDADRPAAVEFWAQHALVRT